MCSFLHCNYGDDCINHHKTEHHMFKYHESRSVVRITLSKECCNEWIMKMKGEINITLMDIKKHT